MNIFERRTTVRLAGSLLGQDKRRGRESGSRRCKAGELSTVPPDFASRLLSSVAALSLALILAPTRAAVGLETNGNLELARQLNQAFADVAQRVSAAVVVINVTQKGSAAEAADEDEGPSGSLPPGFWRHFHEQFRRSVPEQAFGQGSGVIIRPDGYILTNSHVVEDAETIQVRLQDGRTFPAVLRGVDPQSDVAVLKIQAQGLPAARFADSAKIRVGEFAIAVGTPFSLDYSVTFGHVSAKGRSNVLDGYEGIMMDQDFIQTDALINPGNSGGPLVNIDGEIIGINTLIQGLHTGIGFAIPSNLAKEVSDQLIADGKFTRAWLGVSIGALRGDPDLPGLINGIDDGVVVFNILTNGPAAKSDLRAGDVITAVDGRRVSTPQQLRTEVRGKRIGQPVVLDVFRRGTIIKVSVSPTEWIQPSILVAKSGTIPAPQGAPAALGVTVQSLTPEVAARFGAPVNEGVVVASVEKNSPAARKGLKAGDIITAINEQPVNSPKQFSAALKKADLNKGILMNFISSATPHFEVIKAQP